ncbi:hypothetical protein A0U40_05270 [[Bacillus] sp. KCTC 13219]|nr:hypothetical protein A0U40_05270 [[Bacillus] sp. KCTC 13219]
MITYKDIKKAVNQKLNVLGVEINSKDVSEGFSRPSFFVQLENPTRSSEEDQVHKSMTVQIYYFPTDRYEYSIEVLDMQENLEELFDLKLQVKDRLINIDETHAGTTDGVLSFSFDIEFYDGRNFTYNIDGTEPPFEPMEELDFEREEE